MRLIYHMFLCGYTSNSIAQYLTSVEIPSPGGRRIWYASTIHSILMNEKYKGDALLQKSFIEDYLTKKKKKNEGEFPQYYVTAGHEAIVSPAAFDLCRVEILRRKSINHQCFSKYSVVLSNKIKCGNCGGFLSLMSSHALKRDFYWLCNKRRNNKDACSTPYIRFDVMETTCINAMNYFIQQQEDMFKYAQKVIYKSIHSSEKLGMKSKRISNITDYLSLVQLGDMPVIDIPDEIKRILINEIIVKGTVAEIHFIDDSICSYSIIQK